MVFTGTRLFLPFMLIVVQFTHLLSHETIHMFFCRHVESNFNEWADEYHKKKFFGKLIHILDKRNWQKDIGISKDGKEEMTKIWQNFQSQIYSIDYVQKLLQDPKTKIEFASSNLARAQLSLIAALRNMQQNAEGALKEKLENYRYTIREDLRENGGSQAQDAMTLFETKMLNKKNKCVKWKKYLIQRFHGGNNDEYQELYNDLFKTDFMERLCQHTEADVDDDDVDGASEHAKMKHFGKTLNKMIDKGVKVLFIGGHSNWFGAFVDKFVPKTPIKNGVAALWVKYGGNEELHKLFHVKKQKVENGHWVDVVLKKNGDIVEIVSIQEIFPKEGVLYKIDQQ